MMKYLLKIAAAFVLLFPLGKVFAQSTITASVLDGQDSIVRYFDVVLLNAKDSSILKGASFDNGRFLISLDQKMKEVLLLVHCIGYEDHYTHLNINPPDSIDLGVIKLKGHTLRTVEVSAKKPDVEFKNGSITYRVANTMLSNAGNSIDVLKNTPLVMASDEGVGVVARSHTAVYINGRKVGNMQSLKALDASRIESVQVVTDPGAEFDADEDAVILITLKRATSEKIHVESGQQLRVGRLTGGNADLNVAANGRRSAWNFSGGYDRDALKIYSNSNKEITLSDQSIAYSDVDKVYQYGANTYSYRTDGQITINGNNALEISYDGWYSDNDQQSNTHNMLYSKDYDQELDIVSKWQMKSMENNAGLSFIHRNDSLRRKLSALADYSGYRYSNVNPISYGNSDYQNTGEGSFDVFTGKVDYSFMVRRNQLSAGAKAFSIVHIDEDHYDGSLIDNRYDLRANYTENNAAAFVSLKRRIGKRWMGGAGIRAEYNMFSASYINAMQSDTAYLSFFPSIKLAWMASQKWRLQMAAGRKIYRPNYQELNPAIVYQNPYYYTIGNPHLHPAYSNQLTVAAVYGRSLIIMGGVAQRTNEIGFYVDQDSVKPDIMLQKSKNYSDFNLNIASLNVMYSLRHKQLDGKCSAGIQYPLNIPVNDHSGIRYVAYPILQFKGNLNYTISDAFGLGCDGLYRLRSGDISLTAEQKAVWQIAGGIQIHCLHKHLNINLYVHDIFETSDVQAKRSIFNISEDIYRSPDSRYLQARISWQFGSGKALKERDVSNEDEKDRIR